MTVSAVKNTTVAGAGTGLFLGSLSTAIYFGQPLILLLPFAALLLLAGWQFRVQLFYLLLLVLPFSVEVSVTPALGTDFPDEGLMLLVSMVFAAFFLHQFKRLHRVLQHPVILVLLAWTCWMILCISWSENPLLSAKYVLAKSWYTGAFVLAPVLLFRHPGILKRSISILAVSMLLVTLISLYRHGITGFQFARVNDALSPFFRNHVNYSALLVCMIPVWAAALHLAVRPEIKWLIRFSLAVCLIALFFSYARGAWLALLTGAAGYWLIRKRIVVYGYLFMLMLAAGTLYWLKTEDRYLRFAPDYQRTIFHPDFGQHMVATYKLRDMSAAERFHRWIAGIRMAAERPVTGFGPNTFYPAYQAYTLPAFKTWVSDNPEHSTVHNYFLLVLAEQGIPGLFCWILLSALLLGLAQRLWHKAGDPFTRIAAITTGVVLLMVLTINSLSDMIETDKLGSVFYLCAAVLVALDMRNRKPADL